MSRVSLPFNNITVVLSFVIRGMDTVTVVRYCTSLLLFLRFYFPLVISEGMYGHYYFQQSIDQRGMIASPARGRLDRENENFPVPAWRPIPLGVSG